MPHEWLRTTHQTSQCGGGKKVGDLPTTAGHTSDKGRSLICYNFVLGQCWGRGCTNKKGYLQRMQVPNDFADEVCTILKPGIKYMMNSPQGPGAGKLPPKVKGGS